MSKLTIVGNAAVLTSALKVAVIKTLSKFKPEALKLKDDKGAVQFIIGLGNKPAVSQYGVAFNGEAVDGSATVTMSIPDGVAPENKADWAKDTFGYAILSLNTLETQATTEMAITAGEFEAMNGSITVM